MSAPFCDYLACTVPLARAEDLVEELNPICFEALGTSESRQNGTTNAIYRFPDGGTVRLQERVQVLCVGASGAALAAMRTAHVYANFLAAVGGGAHRVTQVDCALDVLVDAPPVLSSVLTRARLGEISLTRKAVRPVNVRFLDRLAHYDPTRVTGTVYLGNRQSEAYARVYDKRNEMIDAGKPDPGPLTRVEVVARGGLGVSLRDAWQPAELFYHLASPGLVTRPAGVADWVPRGEGFVLPKRTKLDPAAALKRRIDQSLDLEAMIELADRAGPHGRPFLLAALERRIMARGSTPQAAADNPSTALSAAFRATH